MYDSKYNQIYIGVGNGAPWNHKIRSGGKGDNWFLASIVALNADTGEYVWHYQTTPAETWASGIDKKTGRPVENPQARMLDGSLILPGGLGAHHWHPMSYRPDTVLVYIPAQEIAHPYDALAEYEHHEGLFVGVGSSSTTAKMAL